MPVPKKYPDLAPSNVLEGMNASPASSPSGLPAAGTGALAVDASGGAGASFGAGAAGKGVCCLHGGKKIRIHIVMRIFHFWSSIVFTFLLRSIWLHGYFLWKFNALHCVARINFLYQSRGCFLNSHTCVFFDNYRHDDLEHLFCLIKLRLAFIAFDLVREFQIEVILDVAFAVVKLECRF